MNDILRFISSLQVKSLLEISALVLSVVNGLWILWFYLRDRPKLVVDPIHPEVYQWWFELPPGECENRETRRFGFLLYASIANKGLRKTSLRSWRLHVWSSNWRRAKLKPMNMPQPVAKLGEHGKVYPTLGQAGVVGEDIFDGGTGVEAGGGVSGMILYIYECYGDEVWNPRIREGGTIKVKLVVHEVFGSKTTEKFTLTRRPFEEIEEMLPGIVEMHESREA